MIKNRKVMFTALTLVGVAALVLAGGLAASNMGFKLNLPLKAQGAGSASGSNYVALPYNQQVGLVTAKDWFVDIGANGPVQVINRHNPATDSFDFYTFGGGNLPPNGFNLEPGKSYIVKVGADQNYIIVGSHNPGLTVTLHAQGAGSASGTNYYSHPYHGIAANARELFEEIGASNVQVINRHVPATDAFDFYTFGGGNIPPNGWDLQPGVGLVVKVGSDVSFVPAHY
jgi:hypothetical protein